MSHARLQGIECGGVAQHTCLMPVTYLDFKKVSVVECTTCMSHVLTEKMTLNFNMYT